MTILKVCFALAIYDISKAVFKILFKALVLSNPEMEEKYLKGKAADHAN